MNVRSLSTSELRETCFLWVPPNLHTLASRASGGSELTLLFHWRCPSPQVRSPAASPSGSGENSDSKTSTVRQVAAKSAWARGGDLADGSAQWEAVVVLLYLHLNY